MKIDLEITRQPLALTGRRLTDKACGAVVEFAGVVRAEENGAPLAALDYEAYDTMARQEMERILRDLGQRYPCRSVEVRHRVGRVAAGEVSIVVRVEAPHRAEAFGLLSDFMDQLKRDVPIWKTVAT